MNKDNENVEINIPIFEILLVVGGIFLIMGILAPFQRIEILGFVLWFDPNFSLPFLAIGSGLVSGYITRKILNKSKNSYIIGLLLGIIGIIIAICIRPTNANEQVNNSNKYETLQKLAELKENGTITELEYETEKAKILRGNK